MRTLISTILFCLLYFFAKAEVRVADTSFPVYDLKLDKHWIDSLKHIVTDGILWEDSKRAQLTQVKYAATCYRLGKYYERLFDSGKLSTMRLAIKYYELTSMPGSSIRYNPEVMGIQGAINRKLSDIYFNGKGIKKDKQGSFWLAWSGRMSSQWYIDRMSKRYFGITGDFFGDRLPFDLVRDSSTHSVFINPFTFSHVHLTRAYKKILQQLAEQLKAFPEAVINVNASAGFRTSSMSGNYLMQRYVAVVKTYLAEKLLVKNEITTDVVSYNWSFRGFEMPWIEIMVTNLKFRYVK